MIPLVVLAGAAGTGKTTVGRRLARRLGAALLDLDTATGPLVRLLREREDYSDAYERTIVRPARYSALTALALDIFADGLSLRERVVEGVARLGLDALDARAQLSVVLLAGHGSSRAVVISGGRADGFREAGVSAHDVRSRRAQVALRQGRGVDRRRESSLQLYTTAGGGGEPFTSRSGT